MPTLRTKSSKIQDDTDGIDSNAIIGKQRSSRRLATKQSYLEDVDDDAMDEESDSDPVSYSDVEDDDGLHPVKQSQKTRSDKLKNRGSDGKTRPEPPENRRSARSTKFSSSMAEPSMSMKDFLVTTSKPKTKEKTGKKSDNNDLNDTDESDEDSHVEVTKSKNSRNPPKQRNKSPRSSKGKKPPPRSRKGAKNSDESSESSGDDDDEDEGDNGETEEPPLKIQKIIASRTETIGKWREICKNMCTSEIHFGSRWFQDDNGDDDSDSKSNDDNHLEHPKSSHRGQRQKSFSGNDDDVFEERFLVKWWDLSFLHCSWETQNDIVKQVEGGKGALSVFFRKNNSGFIFSSDERMDGDYFDPGYIQIERILEIETPEGYDCSKSPEEEDKLDSNSFGIILDKIHPEFDAGVGREILIKWTNIPYSDCTHEYERDLILNDVEYKSHLKSFLRRSKKPSKSILKNLLSQGESEFKRLYKIFGEKNKVGRGEEAIEEYKANLQKRVYKNGGQLRDYQAEGVAWMISNYINGRSSILCDEMGLGKTLQTAATCDLILNSLQRQAPILIIAPLSTLSHWYREFHRWTDLNAIVYHGMADDRKEIRRNEFAYEVDRPKSVGGINSLYLKRCIPKKPNKYDNPWMVDVVITTPEMMITEDSNELAAIEWTALIVDEAHRMKNHNSKLAVTLRHDRFMFQHKILLTGTPIQNDVQEFWTILNFIDDEKFGNSAAFLEKYGDMKSKELVDELHNEIRPYILRRLKEDVEKSVPPKEETLIEVELTVSQKQYYRALYEKNLKFLLKNKARALDGPSLNNLAMQLRKVCNHLFLLHGIEEEFRAKNRNKKMSEADLLVEGSGKLVLLDKLLPRLKEEGHRILIFSQFKIMLDILEDYFHARSMKFERIDGSITGNKRQQAIDRFQAPGTDVKDPPFIMMLTTRAGGVGINLTAADTCIIFDSDWNPQNDLQAQARCHRIGQTKSVKVYRLISRKTYEMQMFHMSSLKMGLDQAVLNGVEGGSSSESTLSKEEVEKLLRHGAYDIFNEDKSGNAEAESNEFVQQDIDSILLRRSKVLIHDNTGSNSGVAGGTFSKASFKASKNTEGGAVDDIDIEDPDFWKKMIGEPKADDDIDILLTKKRQRKQIQSYSEMEYSKQLAEVLSDIDSEQSDDDDTDLGEVEERSKWGGQGSKEWNKEDAESVARMLSVYGYGRENVFARSLKKTYELSEIKRMSWSIIFAVIKQATDDEAESTQKKDQVAADRSIAKQAETMNGGVLAVNVSSLNDSKTTAIDPSEIKLRTFQKIIRSLAPWFTDVLNDASNFAKSNEPRHDEVIQKLNYMRVPMAASDVASVFATNVWPSLKSRGWKVSLIDEGDQTGKSRYSYKDKEFSSADAVLSAARTFHPELKNVIDTILEQRKESLQQSSEVMELERQKDQSLNIQSLSYESMERFFHRYAPLQLIVDRPKTTRIRLSRKILPACNYLYYSLSLMQRVSKDADDKKLDELSSSLFVDKRIILPHPKWTSRHDAVLIYAISKHGWIDHDSSCLAITSDPSIKWGPPFDSLNLPKTVDLQETTEDNKSLASIARRAAAFMNDHPEFVSELKGFNQHLIIRAFGLARQHGSSGNWFVNPEAMPSSMNFKQLLPYESDGPVELPTKKDLVKRAKTLLSRSTVQYDSRNQARTSTTDSPFSFAVLDQSNSCNLLLAEMIRAIMKEQYGSKAIYRLTSFAMAEARLRLEEIVKQSNELETPKKSSPKMITDHQNLVKHLDLVKKNLTKSARQYKNVLKAILGEEPTRNPKQPDEPLFPVDKSDKTNSNPPEDDLIEFLEPNGEKAIDESRKRILERYGTREGLASLDRGSDGLDLTEIETLIVSAVCTLGLPSWSSSWQKQIESTDPGSGTHDKNHWSYLGNFVACFARDQYNQANEKLARATKELSHLQDLSVDSHANMLKLKVFARSNLEKAQVLYRNKQEVLRQSTISPKKCILLFAKIQLNMTTLDVRPKDGLGKKVYKWMEGEIRKWAEALDLLSENGQPLAFTAIDFLDDLSDNERITIELYASFDKTACRSVVGQAALMSCLRSMFTACNSSKIRTLVESATGHLTATGITWGNRPHGWDCSSDVVLLHRLAKFGFTDELLQTKDSEGEAAPGATIPYADNTYFVPKGLLQFRASQLVSVLSGMDVNQLNETTPSENQNSQVNGTIQQQNVGVHSGVSEPLTMVAPGAENLIIDGQKRPIISNAKEDVSMSPEKKLRVI